MGKSILSYDQNGNPIKFCKKCNTFKSVEEFYHNLVARKDGTKRVRYATYCKVCSSYPMLSEDERKRKNDQRKQSGRIRKYELKQSYGITTEDYDALWEDQNGVCSICQKPETLVWMGKVKRLAVDHCHQTGKIRGLLCTRCNWLLGHINDDTTFFRSIFERVIAYLEKA